MTTAHKIIRQIMKKQLPQIATIDLIQLIALWAEQMRGPTWGTPIKLDPDIIEDIQDATAELLTRTK